jgi:CRP-like cAMP-binding protein
MITIMSHFLVDGLSRLAEREQELAAGEILFRPGDPVRSVFVVIAGAMRLARSLPHGSELTLQRAGPGAILAEASLFADLYHCEAVATEASVLRVAPKPRVDAAFRDDSGLAQAWARHLAQEVQHSRAQAQILALKTVSERIDAWIALNGGALASRGCWRQMAAEIGVTPEAVYRELARRRGSVPSAAPPLG